MSDRLIRIRELSAWGFDAYAYRPHGWEQTIRSSARDILAERLPPEQSHVLLAAENETVQELFDSCAKRPDLLAEMAELSWSLGLVDLRSLVAFQRRLAFSSLIAEPLIPGAEDWPALFALSFRQPKPLAYELTCVHARDRSTQTLTLRSDNPDLHVRITNDPASPLHIHAGGPFFEVACFRGRWFLRDGYHRAHALLASGVFVVPAVIVRAESLEELGANHPWFFPEDVLFSRVPPLLVDFLNDDLVLEYQRASFVKTIRIQIEETLQPATPTGERP